eukprot:g4627.t1
MEFESLSTKCKDIYNLLCVHYYTPRERVLMHARPFIGVYFSAVALFSRLINVIGFIVFFVLIADQHSLWTEEKPVITPLMRKANEWLFFDELRTKVSNVVSTTFNCSNDQSFAAPVSYESSRYNDQLCDTTASSTRLQVITSSTWSCLSETESKTQITASTQDSSNFLAIPTAVVSYTAKDRSTIPNCESTNMISGVSVVRDVEKTMLEMDFFVSTMYRFDRQSDANTIAEDLQTDETYSGLGGEFSELTLVDTDGNTVNGCIDASTGNSAACQWTWTPGSEPEYPYVTLKNLLDAAGSSTESISLQDNNAAFKDYFDSKGIWPTSTVSYPYQFTGIELGVVVKWNNAPVCDGLAFEYGPDASSCSSSTTGSRPLTGTISVKYNPTYRPLETSVSASGAFTETFGVRITMGGSGYVVGDYDVWLVIIPLVYSILAVTLVTCCMETCMFMRCKEGKLGKGRPFYIKMWTCCSSVLVRLSGMNMPKFLEPCPRYCRSIWHSKTRIAHIRKKFALQRNFHKQQDDFLDERQVLLHRVKFEPQSIINNKNNTIEDVSRTQLQSLLGTISTDRSQLERIVRKELEVETRGQEKKNLLVARLATVQLLLTSGVSEDEMEATIMQPPKKFDRHRNLLRAMFLEFADVLATLLDENRTSLRPPSRDLSADNLKLYSDESDEEKIMESQTDDEESSDTDAATDTDYETDEEFKYDSDDDNSSKAEGTKEHKKSRQSTAAGDDIREFCMELQNVGFDFSSSDDEEGVGGGAFEGF